MIGLTRLGVGFAGLLGLLMGGQLIAAHEDQETDLAVCLRALTAAHPLSSNDALLLHGHRINLLGFERSIQLSSGTAGTLIIISCMRGSSGSLLSFSGDGKLVGANEVGAEIGAVVLFDLIGSGTPQVLVDELVGWGTDLEERRFVLYTVGPGSREIWHAVSFSGATRDPSKKGSQIEGFVSPQPPGLESRRPRLCYFQAVGGRRDPSREMKILTWDGQKVVETRAEH